MSLLGTLFRQLADHGPDEDAVMHDAAQQPEQPLGLPVMWTDPEGRTHLRGADAPIVTASGAQVAAYAQGNERRTCGECKHFDLTKGRHEMARQRLAERLVHEDGWQLRHLGVPPEHVALCAASGGQTAVGSVSKACDQFRPRFRFRGR